MTTGGAPAHAGLAVSRGRECGRSLLVTPRRGGLRARQAHSAALRCQGGTRQQSRDNDAQHKTRDAGSVFCFHVNAQGHVRDAALPCARTEAIMTWPAVYYGGPPYSLSRRARDRR